MTIKTHCDKCDVVLDPESDGADRIGGQIERAKSFVAPHIERSFLHYCVECWPPIAKMLGLPIAGEAR